MSWGQNGKGGGGVSIGLMESYSSLERNCQIFLKVFSIHFFMLADNVLFL